MGSRPEVAAGEGVGPKVVVRPRGEQGLRGGRVPGERRLGVAWR